MFSSITYTSGLALAMVGIASAQAPAAATDAASIAIAAAQKLAKQQAATANQNFYNYIFIILASLIVGLIMWRAALETVKWIRMLACLNSDTQTYFIAPSMWFAAFKKHVLYAPVLSKRHNREIQLSSAMNVGTLPTRFQLFFLSGIFATNVAFCVVSIPFDGAIATVAPVLRNRTGILAVVVS